MNRESHPTRRLRAVPAAPEGVSKEAFAETLKSQATLQRVATQMASIFEHDGYVIKEAIPVSLMNDQQSRLFPYGALHLFRPPGSDKEVAIGTALSFPSSLHTEAHLEVGKAINLAADFVIAFGVLNRGQMRGHVPQTKTHAETYDSCYWPNEFNIEGGQRATVLYRAAATIALRGSNLQGISIEQPPQIYPAQIAALLNPLPVHDIKGLSAMATAGA